MYWVELDSELFTQLEGLLIEQAERGREVGDLLEALFDAEEWAACERMLGDMTDEAEEVYDPVTCPINTLTDDINVEYQSPLEQRVAGLERHAAATGLLGKRYAGSLAEHVRGNHRRIEVLEDKAVEAEAWIDGLENCVASLNLENAALEKRVWALEKRHGSR